MRGASEQIQNGGWNFDFPRHVESTAHRILEQEKSRHGCDTQGLNASEINGFSFIIPRFANGLDMTNFPGLQQPVARDR
jgi:hypothetical protein